MRVQVSSPPVLLPFVLFVSFLVLPCFVSGFSILSDPDSTPNHVVSSWNVPGSCVNGVPCPRNRLHGFILMDTSRYYTYFSPNSPFCNVNDLDFRSLPANERLNLILFVTAGQCSIEQKYRNALQLGLKALIVVGESSVDGGNAILPSSGLGDLCGLPSAVALFRVPRMTIRQLIQSTNSTTTGRFGSVSSDEMGGCDSPSAGTSTGPNHPTPSPRPNPPPSPEAETDDGDDSGSSNRKKTIIITEVVLSSVIFLLPSRWVYVRYRARRAAQAGADGLGVSMDQYRDLSGNDDEALAAGLAADAEHHRSFWSRSIAEPTAPEL